MPGRFFLTRPLTAAFSDLGLASDHIPQNPPRRNIKPGEEIAVLTVQGVQMMRWGIIPVGRVNARGRPVMETIVNARSETLFEKTAFDGVTRAVVVVDGWYEWTGAKRRKTAWRIQGSQPLIFAAIADVWHAPGGREIHQVATVTCAPSADVVDIHHRMGVLLHPKDVATWISGTQTEAAALMRPWPDGQLTVSEADDVDWDAP